jgi:hypothetical protein
VVLDEYGNPAGLFLEDCPKAAAAFEEAAIEADPVFADTCPSRLRVEGLIRQLQRDLVRVEGDIGPDDRLEFLMADGCEGASVRWPACLCGV